MPLGITWVFLSNCDSLGLSDPSGLMANISHEQIQLGSFISCLDLPLCYNSLTLAAIRFTLCCTVKISFHDPYPSSTKLGSGWGKKSSSHMAHTGTSRAQDSDFFMLMRASVTLTSPCIRTVIEIVCITGPLKHVQIKDKNTLYFTHWDHIFYRSTPLELKKQDEFFMHWGKDTVANN